MTEMSDKLDESLSVNPGEPSQAPTQAKDAGHDESIAARLEKNPESKEARLDRALDESMDASDPPASTQPVHNHQPAPSSGYDEEAERKLKADN
ncbi:hypothetical protein M9980_09615 [Sphingomonas donggukensis]|uniref:Uncharacterized protein n=1 Tax=Sphingomonas donggukensis TaxID=2949093 RepID=A0ABY4TRG3_9SPHN|nr:hypothetical protein [Sphingomonas donggukensis]URW74827.1 hypothetical protein M9980_09615 [Sphingomonas donggukensis]